jgi:hypothetical protein
VCARAVDGRLPPGLSAIPVLTGEEGWDMNRMRLVALCVAVSLGCFSMAFGIDLTDPSKAPATYVKMVKQGDKDVMVFDDTTHWFSAVTFNKVMGLYGWTLTDPSKVSATYAKVVKKDGKDAIVFDETASMYSPSSINRILSAYGLTLTDPSKLPTNFVKVIKKDGKDTMVFDETSSSYSAKSMHQILSAYSRADAAK